MRLGIIGSPNRSSLGGIYSQEEKLEYQKLVGELENYSYTNKSFSISANVTQPEGMVVSRDGKYLYVVDGLSASQSIDRYEFSTPFEVDTLSYSNQTLSIGTIDLNPRSIFINDDGTRIFATGVSADRVFNWYLPTPYSLTGAIFGNVGIRQVYAVTSSTTTGVDALPHGIAFGNNGTRMYIAGSDLDRIYQYDLSTAWDVTTAAFTSGTTLSISARDTDPRAISLSSDGTKLYVVGQSSDSVHQYDMSTAWDITSATYSASFSIASQESLPSGMYFKPDGTKMYIVGTSNDTVYQYTLSTAWSISTASYDSVSYSVTTNDGFPSGLTFSNDGTKMFICGDSGNAIDMYTLSTAWNISTSSYVAEVLLSTAPLSLSALNDIDISSDGNYIYILDGTRGVHRFEMFSPYDIRYMNVGSYSLATYSTTSSGLTFSLDGTKMYVVEDAGATPNDRIYQWNLSLPWIPMEYTTTYSAGYSISTQETQPTDLCINKNGTRIFVVGSSGDKIYQYNLSTPFDISTASYSQKKIELNDIETIPTAICCSESMHRIYIVGQNSDIIYQFDYIF